MIGSFWNLCRACPSMPVDKLHSEYRSTYRWHEYTGPRQEVVRRAPQGGHANAAPPSDEKRHDFGTATRIDEESHEQPKLEPALPRRKKHPDLAYRHHEFILPEGNTLNDVSDGFGDRARSEERGVSHWRPSRRSKSEGPARSNTLTNGERRRDSDPDIPESDDTGRDSGLLKKAISKISTEYRLQFAWPQGHTSRRDAAGASTPRKSQSMGALKPAANAIIHRKRTEFETKDGTASELEPLVNESNTIKEEDFRTDTEYNKEFRPFSQYEYNEGRFVNKKPPDEVDGEKQQPIMNGGTSGEWYKEVVELRKKAGEYKNRGWGSKFGAADVYIYNKQVELWDQVSRRSSLSALSLASTAHRSFTKEEKDQENNKKSSPTKALRNAENSARIMKDMIRHHLERTTGGTEFDGLILSPTREKLEPTIPKRDDDSRGSQKNSPKKNSPQKTALQKKNSLKSKSALRTARSHSVGPADMSSNEKRSPKRQSRSATVKEKKAAATATSGTANEKAAANTVPVTKRPRPSSLNTTASSRSKSSSVPPKFEEDRLAKSKPNKIGSHETNAKEKKGPAAAEQPATKTEKGEKVEKCERAAPEVAEPEAVVDLEPVVKSPPEPTRVKSPEQIIMRSPDPVNWTVPLDTGKTFTVTQNVREGDLATRPHSEVKAWTPPDVPPPVAQSAPPQLTEPCKDQARRLPDYSSSNTTEDLVRPPPAAAAACSATVDNNNTITTNTVTNEDGGGGGSRVPADAERPLEAATTATSLQPKTCPYKSPDSPTTATPATAEAGSAATDPNTAAATVNPAKSLASDVLQKARDRFDSFWRRNSNEEAV